MLFGQFRSLCNPCWQITLVRGLFMVGIERLWSNLPVGHSCRCEFSSLPLCIHNFSVLLQTASGPWLLLLESKSYTVAYCLTYK